VSADTPRPLRADAQLNHERLLDVAGRAFARDGAEASMKAIAAAAGVGVGTLYRRFPTREQLVEATYRNETARLCRAAPELLTTLPAADALRRWMDLFVTYTTTKHGMGAALRAILLDDGERMRTRYLLADAVAVLLAQGAEDGTLRADADAYEVLLAIGGMTLMTGEPNRPDLTARLLDLLLDGLAPNGTTHRRRFGTAPGARHEI
jgi:AcrR family transcriptional regulator